MIWACIGAVRLSKQEHAVESVGLCVPLVSGVPLAELEEAQRKALNSCLSLPFSFPPHAEASLSLQL